MQPPPGLGPAGLLRWRADASYRRRLVGEVLDWAERVSSRRLPPRGSDDRDA